MAVVLELDVIIILVTTAHILSGNFYKATEQRLHNKTNRAEILTHNVQSHTFRPHGFQKHQNQRKHKTFGCHFSDQRRSAVEKYFLLQADEISRESGENISRK